MSPKPEGELIPEADARDPRIVDTGADSESGHDEWFKEQVQTALDNREKNGDAGFKPWQAVMSKFGF